MNEKQKSAGLPCSTCHADCCRLVPVSEHEINERIIPYLSEHQEIIQKLSKQERPNLTCPFVDIEDGHKCGVYEVRPLVCRYFGEVDHFSLTCPYAPWEAKKNSFIPLQELSKGYERDKNQGKPRGALLGATITWKSLLGEKGE